MKTIGLLGGTGWVSTLEYYKLINRGINKKLGGFNSARCLIYSFNYANIYRLNEQDNHAGVLSLVLDAAKKLKAASADGLVLCANTLHQYVDELEQSIMLPIIHIADATADVIKKKELKKIGLLGTKYTMEMDFYTKRLSWTGIKSILPNKEDRNFIHDSIMNEMLKEIYKMQTKNRFLSIIDKLVVNGAEGIVLGCTEIPLLIKQEDVNLPVFNTLEIHAEAVTDFIIDD